MNRKQIILLIIFLTISGLIIGGVAWYLLSQYAPKYTAETLIKVLPYAEKDPMTIGTPQIDKDVQYGFRVSMATLIKQQSTLERLIDRDKIQETQWFKRFGDVKAISNVKAVKDLEKNFGAYAQKDGEFVMVSMTCGDKEEAAAIVDEMVDLFLALQGTTKRAEVAERLVKLTARQNSLQRDLDSAERALQDVRTASGLADLKEHSYPHPITVRLNRLELERDNCHLEIAQLRANIKNLEKHGATEELKNANDNLAVLESKLEGLNKMVEEAAARKRDFDLARIQYQRRVAIRDERKQRLDSVKEQIEKWRIIHEDPETPKVLFVGYAPVPLEASSPRWEIYFPGGAILGLIFGIALALLSRKAKVSEQ
jgi:uncharacterized protein involved in exopolysaccharide biosynthesis